MTEARPSDRRVDDRHAIDLPGIARAWRWGPHDVRVVDASAGGAMVAITATAARGDEIILAAGGIEIVATIAWATDGFLGLAFHRRLSAAEIAAWRRAARTRPRS